MLTQDQHSALETLRSRTWQHVGRVTWLSGESRVKELCKSLEDATPHLLIPSLAATLINFPVQYRPTLNKFIHTLIDKIPAEKWSYLDQEIRSEVYGLRNQFQYVGVKERSPDLNNPLERLIALCYPSGFTRERAVESFGKPFSSALISLLLLRCNDWVAPVKQVAQQKLFELPHEIVRTQIGEVLTVLTLLTRSSRNQGNEIERHIDSSILSTREGLEAVLTVLKTSDNNAKRRACSRFLLRHHERLAPSDLDIFFSHGSPSELGMLLRAAREFPKQDQRAILDRVKDSRLVVLRRERLRLLGECAPEDGESEFIESLHDVSKSIRTIARFHLKSWDNQRIADHYATLLSSDPANRKFRGSLFGLSETSPKEGHKIALRYLENGPTVSRMKICIACLDLHTGKIADDQLIEWLSSSIIAISHASYRAVVAQKRQLPPKLLAEIAGNVRLAEHSRHSASQLLQTGHKWQTLPWLLDLSTCDENKIREQANASLTQWLLDYGNSFVNPTDYEKKVIDDHFQNTRKFLDPGLEIQFANLLKSFITV